VTEYKIIVDNGFDDIRIVSMDGDELPVHTTRLLYYGIKDKYELKSYLYLAAHDTEDCLYKIGVSRDPNRRENEIDGFMVHWIPCSPEHVFRLEWRLHKHFADRRIEGEWFDLVRDSQTDLVELLTSLKTEQDLSIWLNKGNQKSRVKYLFVG
jgi:hypothetical protein